MNNSKRLLLSNNSSEGKSWNTFWACLTSFYRQAPTSADREAYESLKATPPTAATHPNTFAWFILTGMFTDPIKATWTGAQAAPAKAAKQVAAKVEAKKEEPKVEAKADDDDMDLFGDDDEDTEVSFIFNRQALFNY